MALSPILLHRIGAAPFFNADDTLLLIPAELGAVQALKSLLDQFSAATALMKINYHKSTLVAQF